MPSGCEFRCDNKECKCYNTGFTMLAPWPIADINDVIHADNIKKHKEFQEELIALKKEGRKYTCINYPNENGIFKVGYKIQKWCDKCKIIWNYEAIIQDKKESMEETLAHAEVEDVCSECGDKLKTFSQTLEDGIECFHCKQRLIPQVWFSNET